MAATVARSSGNIKSEPAASSSFISSSSSTDSVISSLPTFARTNWVSRFLPTLYHRFGSSTDPWAMFTKGDEMLSIVQEVLNAVYPNIKYRVKWGDKICTAVLFPLVLFATHFIPSSISR